MLTILCILFMISIGVLTGMTAGMIYKNSLGSLVNALLGIGGSLAGLVISFFVLKFYTQYMLTKNNLPGQAEITSFSEQELVTRLIILGLFLGIVLSFLLVYLISSARKNKDSAEADEVVLH